MSPNIGMTDEAKRECAEAMSKVLADTFVLYLKTHSCHWNVEGAQFVGLHALFEEQYRDLWNTIDEIAERIRALDALAPGTTAKLKALAEVKETDGFESAGEMLQELLGDNETVVNTLRAASSTAQAAGDEASAGLLADRIAYHEKQMWMMKSILK